MIALAIVVAIAGGFAAGAVIPRSSPERTNASEEPTGVPRSTSAPTSTTVPSTTAPPTTAPPTTAPPTSAPPTTTPPPPAPEPLGLQPGAQGEDVLALQTTLESLGYWLGGADGRYASLTQQAVMAFQKAAGLGRDGIAGPETLAALAWSTRLAPAVVTDGIEIDLERQLILVVQGGEVIHVLNTSTGRSGWRTPQGDYAIDRQIDGMRSAPLGDLYRPKYFNGGIAVHGSTSIPGQPASHGCARVSFPAIDMLWASGLAEVGTRVVVY